MVKCFDSKDKENKIVDMMKLNIKQDQVFRISSKKCLIFYLKGGVSGNIINTVPGAIFGFTRETKYFETN